MRDIGTLANIARQSVSALTVGQDMGLNPDRSGKCRCIFHQDQNPSLKLYPGSRGYYCFVCGAHGDVVDLTAAVNGVKKSEAIKILNDRYALGLPIESNQDEERLRKAREEAAKRAEEAARIQTRTEALSEAVEATYRVWALWRQAAEITRPVRPTDPITDEYAQCKWNEEMAYEAYQQAQDDLFSWRLSQRR